MLLYFSMLLIVCNEAFIDYGSFVPCIIIKALTLLEYLVRHGPERIIDEVRDSLYRLRSMSGFHYTDEGRDRAGGVREKAKHIIELVSDTELLRAEREKARQNRQVPSMQEK